MNDGHQIRTGFVEVNGTQLYYNMPNMEKPEVFNSIILAFLKALS